MITVTSTALLEGLRDQGNDRIWTDFCTRYRPVLESFARRLGLREQDAQDAVQETLLAFTTAYQEGKYDRSKGRLRSWLSGIAVNKIRDIQRRRRDVVVGTGQESTAFLNELPDDRTMSERWEAQWQEAVVKQCVEEVRSQVQPTTIKAFELFVLKEWPAEKVAAELNISRNAVYQAKHHVLERMRKIKKYWDENF